MKAIPSYTIPPGAMKMDLPQPKSASWIASLTSASDAKVWTPKSM